MPCGDMAPAIVYILARFGCAKAPKRIAPRLVRIIPVWHIGKAKDAVRAEIGGAAPDPYHYGPAYENLRD